MTQARLRDSENPFLLVVPASETHEAGYLRDFKIVRRNQILAEYQLYAVEQWVVDRSKTASTIVASTNDPSHKIVVDVLTPRAETVEARSAIWDRTLLKARTDGARPRQTPLGFILVVSLTSFRSDLSIVLIIGGDLGQAQDALFTNINLRRLGCGGRSGLSLGEPSLSQQDRLLQLYRLPSSGSGSPSFSLVLLSLIRLVQSALSLFNLGPLCSPVNPLREADGLLCDVTIDGLAMWQMEVAEPLIQTELGENVLSPATLAALLSLIISVRCRLLMINVHAVPSDPFQDPLGFLRVYDSFMRSTKSPYESRYLSAKGIHYLRQQYVRTTKDTLKRAIRNRLDDIRGDSTAAGGVKGAVMEGETTDIASFVTTLQASHSNDVESVVALWKGKIRKDKLAATRRLGSAEYDGNAALHRIPAVLITDSEDEAGIGSKLLKGVSKRTRKIGDGVSGLLGSKDDTIRARRHGLQVPNVENEFANHASDDNDVAQRRSPAQSLLSLNFLRSSAASSASESTADEGEVVPPPRPTHMRRAATDIAQAPSAEETSPVSVRSALPQTRRRRHSVDCMRGLARNGKIMSTRRMKVETDLHMSYYKLRAREEQLARLVIALESVYKAYDGALSQIGVRLKARGQTLRDLSERAKELSHGIEAFTSQSDGPSTQRTASVSSEATYMDREALVSLALGSERLAYAQTLLEEKLHEVEDFDRTLHAKVGGRGALLGGDGGQSSARLAQAGSVVQGLASLLRNSSSGTRKVLEAVGMWSTWLAYLEGRLKSYFR